MSKRAGQIRTMLFCVLILPVLWPVAELYLVELFKPGSWRAVINDAAFANLPGLFFNSCFIALLAGLVATIIATVHFIVIRSLPGRFRAFWMGISVIPIFIPTHVLGLAWIQAIGRAGWITAIFSDESSPHKWLPAALYSPGGCAAILASHFYPLVLGLLLLGWRAGDASRIESLRVYLPPRALWLRAVGGWLRPWLATGVMAVYSLAVLDYIVPFLLARHVFAVEILTSFNLDYLPGKAAVLSLPLLFLSGTGFAFVRRFMPRTGWSLFQRIEAELPALPRASRVSILSLGFSLILLTTIMPIGTFLLWAGALESYSKIWASSEAQISSSLLWTLSAAAFATLLALLSPTKRFGAATLIPFLLALPGSILGIAHIRFWNRNSPGDILGAAYDSGFMLPLGLTGIVLPAAILLVSLRRRQCPSAYTDFARITGNHRNLRALLATSAHFMMPAALAAFWSGFILAMQESHASILLVAPGQETLAIRTCTLLHFAPDSLLGALCLIALALMFAVSAAMLILGRLGYKLGTHYAGRILLD